MDLFEKVQRFTAAKELMGAGLYAYYRPLQSAQTPEIRFGGRRIILVGSNNYLGLSDDPRMKRAAIDAIERYGTGCNGSRLLNGSLELHEELENKLARFKKREAALVFATGYQTNLGVVSCFLGRNDVLIADKLNHASIYDGAKLSLGEVRRYRHNDMRDLEAVLKSIPAGKGKFLVVDGVFSMEGDICNLPEIVRLGKAYGARILVDDAHSTGVLGEGGRGTCEHYGLENGEVDLVLGTCSKSFSSVGGFVVGSADLIHYIRHSARSMIFSAALPASNVASISKALDILQEEPERRERLWANARKMQEGFKSLGFDIGSCETPIVPVIVGDDMTTLEFARMLFEAGVFAHPVLSPAVPPGRSLIRTSYMATHTDEQLDRVLEVFEHVGKKLGVLGAGRPSVNEVAA